MQLPSRLDAALARLSGSLTQLELAAERRADLDVSRADRALELRLLQEDRARLGEQLEVALTRGNALLAANAEVSARLDRAIGTVRAILDQVGGKPDAGGRAFPLLELVSEPQATLARSK